MTLEELHDELGTLKWVGSDEGWDLAVEAVRKLLRDEIKAEKEEEPENAFKLSDEEIEELRKELNDLPSGGIITLAGNPEDLYAVNEGSTYTQLTLPLWDKCEVCGRDKKYVSGLDLEMTCKYGHTTIEPVQTPFTTTYGEVKSIPCAFDNIDWKTNPIMGLSCSCPKCSPQC